MDNLSTAIFLINKSVRAIAVTYEKIDISQDTTQMKYTPAYLSAGKLPEGAVVFKTMDQDVKVNDFVVVPTDTRHGLTVCKVVAVDVEIDFNDNSQVHWIVGTVDTKPFEEIRQMEAQAIAKIKQARVNQERDKLREALLKDIGEVTDIPMLDHKAEETVETEKE